MNKQVKKWLAGISIPQEYVCLGLQDVAETLTISLTFREREDSIDVTRQHVFLGYKPLLMAIVLTKAEETIFNRTDVCLSFSNKKFELNKTWNGFPSDKNGAAKLSLSKIDQRNLGDSKIVFYRGGEGQHFFISFWHQRVNNLWEQLRRKPQGNVGLEGNLYEQVRIAYSIPRLISMITVFDGTLMNLFPTDLHGMAGTDFYLGSLRIDGEACQQVEQQKRIVISEVDFSDYRRAYALGKQHMKPMNSPSEFDLNEQVSATFKFPLPANVGKYRELEVIDHLDAGIHRIFIYKIIRDQSVRNFNPLGHIHSYYAQWRNDQGLTTKYLFR